MSSTLSWYFPSPLPSTFSCTLTCRFRASHSPTFLFSLQKKEKEERNFMSKHYEFIKIAMLPCVHQRSLPVALLHLSVGFLQVTLGSALEKNKQ